jgi:4-phosphopantoate--beta-alanine ligase
MGKEVIVIDLNPLSRSAQQASITIVDELSRALTNMLELIESEEILEVDSTYDHGTVLEEGLTEMLGSFKRP